MSRFWRIVLAACAFLAAPTVGTFGGCTVGVITALSRSQAAHTNNDTFYALIAGGRWWGWSWALRWRA